MNSRFEAVLAISGLLVIACWSKEGPGEDTATDTSGECTGWPTAPGDYVFETAVIMDSVSLPAITADIPACCRDFGDISDDFIESGTSEIDNSLAQLFISLEEVGAPNFEESMNQAINDGTLNIILEHRHLDEGIDPDEFCLVRFNAETDGATGYLALEEFFVPGTGTPRETFAAEMTSGDMTTGRGTFVLLIPLAVPISVEFEDAELTGRADITTDGVTYAAGTLSGYVTLDEFFGGLNDYIQTDCECLSPPDPVLERLADGTVEEHCSDLTPADCLSAGNDTCAVIGALCSSLIPEFTGAADLELDSTRTGYDAISFGMEWTAVPATLSGVTTP